MKRGVAWALLILGAIHIIFGIVRFKEPLADALAAGFVGQFQEPQVRRTAFWFIMVGPLLMLAGHLAVRAVARGDRAVLKIIGTYGLISSIVGIFAYPSSPLWVLLVLSILLIAAGMAPHVDRDKAHETDTPKNSEYLS